MTHPPTSIQSDTPHAPDRAPWQARVASSLDTLENTQKNAQIVRPTPRQQADIDDALERARSTLLGSAQPVLLVAVVGPSGAGKSSLINALAGADIAVASAVRPTTRTLTVYHHASVVQGALPAELVQRASFVSHSREELRNKVLIDTPDVDTFVTSNRALTEDLLKAAGLVMCVVSPERYLEERLWSVLTAEAAQGSTVFVVNKRDLCTDEELAQIQRDIQNHLATAGLHDVPMLSSIASSIASSTDTINLETAQVSAFLTHTLSASDAAMLASRARTRAVESLRNTFEAVMHNASADTLTDVRAHATATAHTSTANVVERCAAALEHSARELRPDLTIANHTLFWGTMRAWLGAWDALTIGLPRLLARVGPTLTPQLRLPSSGSPASALPASADVLQVSTAPLNDRRDDIADTLRHIIAHADQSLASQDPPLVPLSAVVKMPAIETIATHIIADVGALHTHHHNTSTWKRIVAWIISLLSLVGLVGLLGLGVYHIGREVLSGAFGGVAVLAHVLVLGAGLQVILQVLASLLMPTGWRRLSAAMGHRLSRALGEALSTSLDQYTRTAQDECNEITDQLTAVESAVRSAGLFASGSQYAN